MSATSWVCASKFGQKLEGLDGCLGSAWVTGTCREGAALATKNSEMGFWCLPFLQRLSERAGFGETGMRLSGLCRRELEVPPNTDEDTFLAEERECCLDWKSSSSPLAPELSHSVKMPPGSGGAT